MNQKHLKKRQVTFKIYISAIIINLADCFKLVFVILIAIFPIVGLKGGF